MNTPANDTVTTVIAYSCPSRPTKVRVNIGGHIHTLDAEQALELASELMTAAREASQEETRQVVAEVAAFLAPKPSLAEWCASEGLVCD